MYIIHYSYYKNTGDVCKDIKTNPRPNYFRAGNKNSFKKGCT